jgi:hypothetical protein
MAKNEQFGRSAADTLGSREALMSQNMVIRDPAGRRGVTAPLGRFQPDERP